MSCKIKIKKSNEKAILSIAGELIGPDAGKVSKKVKTVCRISEKAVVLDLSEMTMIDSHGLGVLILCWKELQRNNKEPVMYAPPTEIMGIFKRTNLDKIFTFTTAI